MDKTANLDTTISSILYLMTRYSLSKESGIAEIIRLHLQQLAYHPENESKTVQETCVRLSEKWQSIIAYQEFIK